MKAIAFYLPQFHPIEENDSWWGAGFTEWRNVVQARPYFSGHEQPHLPADLGFYDLRLAETRSAQADLAHQYGIDAFCYYHYWFHGRRLLNRPFDEVLSSGAPGFPFCLCWANESWTRTWVSMGKDVLVSQEYSKQDHLEHFRWLCKAFADERYVKVDGRPLFLIYRASKIPAIQSMVDVWRNEADRLGVPAPFLCQVQRGPDEMLDPASVGCDAAVEFAPDPTVHSGPRYLRDNLMWHVMRKLRLYDGRYSKLKVFSYADLVDSMLSREQVSYRRFRCVTPGWDNSARRGLRASVYHGSTPDLYMQWLRKVVEETERNPEGERILFVNAWNEWAEGNHLEPCLRYGHQYLDATRTALRQTSGSMHQGADSGVCR